MLFGIVSSSQFYRHHIMAIMVGLSLAWMCNNKRSFLSSLFLFIFYPIFSFSLIILAFTMSNFCKEHSLCLELKILKVWIPHLLSKANQSIANQFLGCNQFHGGWLQFQIWICWLVASSSVRLFYLALLGSVRVWLRFRVDCFAFSYLSPSFPTL